MPTRRRAAVLAIALVVAACGDGGGEGGTTTLSSDPVTTGTSAPDGTTTSAGPRTVVGEIVRQRRLTTVNGRRAAGGDPLPAGALLSTDGSGVATFQLRRKFGDCDILPGSEIEVLAGPRQLMRVVKGTGVCVTRPGDNDFVELDATHAVVELRDPVFAVTVERSRTTVRVAQGFVQVQGRGRAGRGRLLGPDGQASVLQGQSPRSAEVFERSRSAPLERQAMRRMEESLPPPDYSFPGVQRSPALTRARQSGALRVAVDEGASADAEGFLQAFFAFLADQWSVRGEVQPMSPAEGARALRAGAVEVLVAPTPVAGARSLPFFGDEGGRPWLLQVGGDDARLQQGLRNFLVAALDFGEYGRRYRTAFGRVPDYEAVRPLVFPEEGAERGETTSTTAGPDTSSSTSSTTGSTGSEVTASGGLRVVSATLSAAPASYSGPCPTTVHFSGKVTVEGDGGEVSYRFVRSDGGTGPATTLRFTGGGSQEVSTTWTLGAPGSKYSEWVAVQVLTPQELRSAPAEFTVACDPEGPR